MCTGMSVLEDKRGFMHKQTSECINSLNTTFYILCSVYEAANLHVRIRFLFFINFHRPLLCLYIKRSSTLLSLNWTEWHNMVLHYFFLESRELFLKHFVKAVCRNGCSISLKRASECIKKALKNNILHIVFSL